MALVGSVLPQLAAAPRWSRVFAWKRCQGDLRKLTFSKVSNQIVNRPVKSLCPEGCLGLFFCFAKHSVRNNVDAVNSKRPKQSESQHCLESSVWPRVAKLGPQAGSLCQFQKYWIKREKTERQTGTPWLLLFAKHDQLGLLFCSWLELNNRHFVKNLCAHPAIPRTVSEAHPGVLVLSPSDQITEPSRKQNRPENVQKTQHGRLCWFVTFTGERESGRQFVCGWWWWRRRQWRWRADVVAAVEAAGMGWDGLGWVGVG